MEQNKNNFDNSKPVQKPYDDQPKKYTGGEVNYNPDKDRNSKQKRIDYEPAEEFIDDNVRQVKNDNKNYKKQEEDLARFDI